MYNIYRGGTPDFWYSGYKSDLWVEYKWIKQLPKKGTTPIKADLSGLQTLWLDDAMKKGRNVCVIVGSPQGCAILVDGAWEHDLSHASFLFKEPDVVQWLIRKLCVSNPISGSDGSSDKLSVSNSSDGVTSSRSGSRGAQALQKTTNESNRV
jgi:hypothetical protein